MKKVNLFIVGYPKAGTTSLFYYMQQNKEIFTPRQKELHHFAKDKNEEYKQYHKHIPNFFNYTITEYEKHFSKAKKEKYLLDATPTYIFSKESAKEIHKYNSKAKIIIVVREPIAMLYSLYSQLYVSMNEDQKTFEKAINIEKTRKQGKNIPRILRREPSSLYYSEHIKFSEQINKYYKYFPKSQIKLILFDDLIKNMDEEYSKILSFLSLPKQKVTYKNHNPNERVRFWHLRNLLTNPKIAEKVKKLLSERTHTFLEQLIKKITLVRAERKPLNKEFKDKLKKEYKSEIIKLNNYLHKNNLIKKDANLEKLWRYNEI